MLIAPYVGRDAPAPVSGVPAADGGQGPDAVAGARSAGGSRWITQAKFRTMFVTGPFFLSMIVPTIVFGPLFGEWGTNVIWGAYFGLGWCLAAFWTGNIVRDDLSAAVGLAWAWIALVPLYFGSGALWRRLGARGRKTALLLLALSSAASVPASAIVALDGYGVHLPDYAAHLAASY